MASCFARLSAVAAPLSAGATLVVRVSAGQLRSAASFAARTNPHFALKLMAKADKGKTDGKILIWMCPVSERQLKLHFGKVYLGLPKEQH